MRKTLGFVAALGISALVGSGTAMAQAPEPPACAKTRAEVKADCVQFLKNFQWDETVGNYVLKSGARPPEGVRTREEVRAERNKFLAANTWDEQKGQWVPIPGKAREVSNEPLACPLTRDEVKKDCAQFLKTHRWDEMTGSYVKR